MTQKKAITSSFHTPASTFTSNVPARSPQSNILQSCLSAASPAKHCLWERNRQMSRSACDWQSTAFTSPPLLTLALLLTVQPFHSRSFPWLLPQPRISIVKIWRQACPVGYLQIFNAHRHWNDMNTGQELSKWHGTLWKRSSHDICEKFKSWQRFPWWLINSISAKSPSAVSISMAWKLQGAFLVFLYLLIFVTPIWYKILHFISTNFVSQGGRKHKHLNYLWDLPGRLDVEKSRAKPSCGKGNRL